MTSFLEQFRDPAPEPPRRGDWEATPYARAALEGEVASILAAANGTRNDTLNRAAFNMAQLVAGGQISHETVHDALTGAARQSGLDPKETAKTIASGFRVGSQKARSVPPAPGTPWSSTPTAPGAGPPQAVDGPVEDPYPTVDWAAIWANDTGLDWILEPVIPAGRYIALYSPPKVGKSLLMLELCLAIARGSDALGAPTRATKVLYLDFENDPATDIKARIESMGLGQEDAERLSYMSYPPCPPLDTPAGGTWLHGAARHHGAGLVVIDTISRAISGEENDNNTWLNLYRHTAIPLKRDGTTLVRLDHTGKDEDRGQRGGSAKSGDIDAVWKMSEIVRDTSYSLNCEMARYQVPEMTLNLNRKQWPLGHEVTTDTYRAIQKDAVLKALDDAGLPRNAGRDRCAAVLRNAGLRVRNQTLAGILKERKGGAEEWAPPVPDTP